MYETDFWSQNSKFVKQYYMYLPTYSLCTFIMLIHFESKLLFLLSVIQRFRRSFAENITVSDSGLPAEGIKLFCNASNS